MAENIKIFAQLFVGSYSRLSDKMLIEETNYNIKFGYHIIVEYEDEFIQILFLQ